jgi:hypothetical protein
MNNPKFYESESEYFKAAGIGHKYFGLLKERNALNDRLRAEGYDGIIVNRTELATQVLFDPTNPDIRRSVAPRITKNIVKNAKGLYIYKGKLPESFYKWFGKSAVTDDDGYPLVMFHGTARDITEFKPKQANAIFVTTDTKTAFNFSEISRAWVMEHLDDFITPERQKEIRVEARKGRRF